MSENQQEQGGLLRSLFLWVARLSVRAPFFMLAIALLLVAYIAVFYSANAQKEFTFTEFVIKGSESDDAASLVADNFPARASSLIVAFERTDGELTNEEMAFVLTGVKKEFPETRMVFPLENLSAMSENKKGAFVVVEFPDKTNGEVRGEVERVRGLVREYSIDGVSVFVTGGAAIGHDLDLINEKDLASAETGALPIVVVILAVVFGGLFAMFVPMLVGALTIVLSLGILYGIAQFTEVSSYVFNVVTMLGLGIGIDYSLFLITRFREELRNGFEKGEALVRAVSWASHVIVYSGLTVMVGFAGLFFIPEPFFQSMGMGGVAVVVSALLITLLILPATLYLVGEKLNFPKLLFRFSQKITGGIFWGTLSRFVMRRSVPIILITLAGLLLLSFPATKIATALPGVVALPQVSESRQGYELIQTYFGGGLFTPTFLVAEADEEKSVFDESNIAALLRIEEKLKDEDQVRRVDGLRSVFPSQSAQEISQILQKGDAPDRIKNIQASLSGNSNGTIGLVKITLNDDGYTREAQDFIRKFRSEILPPVVQNGDMQVLVGGAAASGRDYNDRIYGAFPGIIAIMLILTFGILMFFLRSVVLPLKTIIMNLLATGAAYGLLVLLFQMGWGSGVFGETPSALSAVTPILLFTFLFGISMDYEIFLLSRIKEEYKKTHDTTDAVAKGLSATGGLITSAALIMVVVFGAFAFAQGVIIKEIGFGLSAAILLDATIIRALLVPSFMKLAGRWNWWWFGGNKA